MRTRPAATETIAKPLATADPFERKGAATLHRADGRGRRGHRPIAGAATPAQRLRTLRCDSVLNASSTMVRTRSRGVPLRRKGLSEKKKLGKMADPLLAALDRARAGPGDPRAGSHGRARGTHAGRAVPAHAHIALTACGRHTRDARAMRASRPEQAREHARVRANACASESARRAARERARHPATGPKSVCVCVCACVRVCVCVWCVYVCVCVCV